jgi:C1A family cysteine protease
MKTLIFILFISLVFGTVTDEQAFQKFQKFIKKYNKRYDSLEEYMKRFKIFQNNLFSLQAKNALATHHTIGITKFSDLTDEEFRKTYCGLKFRKSNKISLKKYTLNKDLKLPESFDWVTEKNVLGEPKNQYSCGSCWAFSIVGHLEALYYIKYGVHKTFSEQQLVDCDSYDYGCNGGEFLPAYQWIKENGGLESDTDYPYIARDQTCSQDQSKNVVNIVDYQLLETTDEEIIKQYLYEVGPLAIGINANPLNWYVYGVIDWGTDNCPHDDINHAVVLVGYGHDDEEGLDFWRIRNSWGAYWGEKGYFRVSRGKGTCGVNKHVSYATIE